MSLRYLTPRDQDRPGRGLDLRLVPSRPARHRMPAWPVARPEAPPPDRGAAGAGGQAARPGRGRVALLVDYPGLLRAIRALDPDGVPNLAAMVRRAAALGPLLAARAYGAWYDVDEALVAYQAGLDASFVPPVGGATAPTATALVADGLALVRAGQVQALALSGDERLLPLVAMAHSAGVAVGLVGSQSPPGGPCATLADFEEPVSAYARSLTRAEKYRRPQGALAHRASA